MSASNSNGFTIRTVTTAGDTLAGTDDIVIYTFAGAKSVAIAAGSDTRIPVGKMYRITNTATGAITITPFSGQIDGAATKVVPAGGTAISTLTLVNDGAQWRTVEYTIGS